MFTFTSSNLSDLTRLADVLEPAGYSLHTATGEDEAGPLAVLRIVREATGETREWRVYFPDHNLFGLLVDLTAAYARGADSAFRAFGRPVELAAA